MKNYFLKCGWYLFALIGIISCNPDIVDPPVTERKIVALNYVHEDNINGRIINPTIDLDTNIIANYRFVYNSNGTLNSISVFDDSSNFAILQKEVKFVYYPDRVRWYTFNAADTLRERVYDAFFNSKNRSPELLTLQIMDLIFTILTTSWLRLKTLRQTRLSCELKISFTKITI